MRGKRGEDKDGNKAEGNTKYKTNQIITEKVQHEISATFVGKMGVGWFFYHYFFLCVCVLFLLLFRC